MADRTLTINHADGDSETYTIKRDKFAGVRSMSVDGNTVTVDHTAIPKDVAKETTFGGSKSITVKREIEPLLSEVVGGASAAYSLRDLNDKAGNNKVVRVRRASDNHEKDFRAKEIKDIETWVNAQTVLPLDIQELEADGRTGALVEAAAAYSLRNLSNSYAGDVVEVRRNTDGSTQDFNATEVSDNTLTDWVNTSFADDLPLDTSSGAAAAYSLRNLSSSFTGSVVEVRRSSDGEEDSFTASDVADGTLEDWVGLAEWDDSASVDSTGDWEAVDSTISHSVDKYVLTYTANTQWAILNILPSLTNNNPITISVDVKNGTSGNAAVYLGASNVGSGNQTLGQIGTTSDSWQTLTATFNATSSTFNKPSIRFDMTSGTVEFKNFSISQTVNGFVSKWYDQSGNANHATQGTNAFQPKIVDSGTLVSGGLDFDGVDDFLTSLNSSLTDYTFAGVYTVKTIRDNAGFLGKGIGSNREFFVRMKSDGKVEHRVYSTGSSSTFDTIASSASAISADTAAIIAGSFNGTTNAIRLDINDTVLTATSSVGLYAGTSSLTIPRVLGNAANTAVAEFIIYDSDQSDKLRAIEENIGDHYGITLASFSNDGFVKTWYDQSGNTNHATQAVDASQPKIVDGGSLVTGGLDFDGADDQLDFTALNATDLAIFSVVQFDSVSGQERILGEDSSNSEGFGIANATTGFFRASGGSAAQPALNATVSTSGAFLYSANRASNTLGFFTQGVASATATNSDAFNANSIGGATNPVDGSIQEIIIYDSDQSDNRTAIEANIGEVYSIDLPSGVDTGYDQVDGFVETWYDQSGNGNDAVQQVSGSQPKIVDAGVLVSGGIEFDGVNDRLTCSSLYSSDISIFNVVTTSNTVITSNYMRMIHLCDGSDSFQITRGGTTDIGKLISKNTAFQSGTTSFLHGDINGENLISAITSSTDTDAFVDGSLQSSSSASIVGSGNNATTTIGARDDLVSSTFFAGSHAELIIYASDQSDNRVAIETNINDHYDIYA
jgi:hypothetical protein